MKEFQRSSGLSRLSPASRALYGGFLLFVLLGLVSSMALFYDSLGLSAKAAVEHYMGNAADPEATEILLEKSPREILEISHFHLFTMPVVLLVLGHLFLLSRGGRWKAWVVGGAMLFTLLHLLGPWALYLGAPGWVMGATGLPMGVTWLTMLLWPLPELFSRRGA